MDPDQDDVREFVPRNGCGLAGLPKRDPMSKEKPNHDPRQRTDRNSTKQTDKPWKGQVEIAMNLIIPNPRQGSSFA
jgi:hypothetical protein